MQQSIREQLCAGAQTLGLSLSEEELEGLLRYIEQLKRWNKTYNLTAIKNDQQIVSHHILDSLAVIRPLRDLFVHKTSITVLDVGSGGGLPGVVIAIMNPQWIIQCVDAVDKKTSFITLISGILGLNNLTGKHSRIEKLEQGPVDLVISRAFASLVDFANGSGHHVAPDGHLLAMKGRYIQSEVEELRQDSDWQVCFHQDLVVPQLNAERCLIYLQRKPKEERGN